MISDKIKIRVSEFVELIVCNDAQAFGFVKGNQSPNINAFLNKLIPNMLGLRKDRRAKIHDGIDSVMEFAKEKIAQEHIRLFLDTIIDQVYFADNLQTKESDLWIRPTKDKMVFFDEIEQVETDITGMNLSACIRSLLNEYAKMPQFIREKIVFKTELDVISESFYDGRIIWLSYDDKRYKVVVLNVISGVTYDQTNYVVCYDTGNNAIKSFLLPGISNIVKTKKKGEISDKVYTTYRKVVDEYLYVEKETVSVEE